MPRQGITLTDIHAAEQRIRPYIRRTPVMFAHLPSVVNGEPIPVWLKLENLQVAEQVDTRGVLNFVLGLSEERRAQGIVTSSWSVGVALAYTGYALGFPVVVFLPKPISGGDTLARLEQWGPRIVRRGTQWTETLGLAQEFADAAAMLFLHPFSEPTLIAGQGTVGLEILSDVPRLSHLLVCADRASVALGGIALAVKVLAPNVRVIGVTGGDRKGPSPLRRSGDRPIRPPPIARVTSDLLRSYVDRRIVVTDEEREVTLQTLWSTTSISAGPFGATAATAALCGRVAVPSEQGVCALVGASGEEGLFLD